MNLPPIHIHLQALIKMKAFLIYGNLHLPTREGLDPNRIFNQMGFSLRIMSTPTTTGNPTTEGVHQDGGDFSMTVLMKSKNVDYDCGAGKLSIMNLQVPFGVQYKDIDPNDVIDEVSLLSIVKCRFKVQNLCCISFVQFFRSNIKTTWTHSYLWTLQFLML